MVFAWLFVQKNAKIMQNPVVTTIDAPEISCIIGECMAWKGFLGRYRPMEADEPECWRRWRLDMFLCFPKLCPQVSQGTVILGRNCAVTLALALSSLGDSELEVT